MAVTNDLGNQSHLVVETYCIEDALDMDMKSSIQGIYFTLGEGLLAGEFELAYYARLDELGEVVGAWAAA